MKAIMIMFDSLNRRYLEPYGSTTVKTPNFTRLAERSAVFESFYAGSMPCMPARREIHTGRYNFFHRGWGPVEPFDESMPEMLKKAGVLTHLITDHYHYWEDGGATYHNRYSSWEGVRGQEGDKWKAQVSDPDYPAAVSLNPEDRQYAGKRQDYINRQYMQREEDTCIAKTFALGEQFIRKNAGADNWFLQLECFDPHEPFFASQTFLDLYGVSDEEAACDWPPYGKVTQDDEFIAAARKCSMALHSMCDAYVGRVLDMMDELDMWKDTMLIINTDHGYMMGEHGWWAKNIQPSYDEIIHTPFFMWDPRCGVKGERRKSLASTIDIAPTMLDFFGLKATPLMNGVALGGVAESDSPVHDGVLFGMFGSMVSVTDGRYVHMRAGEAKEDYPLCEYTLMPTRMVGFMSDTELQGARLSPPLSFTRGMPVLEIPQVTGNNMMLEMMKKLAPESFENHLFDLETDPGQQRELEDSEVESRMMALMAKLMRENDAPVSQFMRLGLEY